MVKNKAITEETLKKVTEEILKKNLENFKVDLKSELLTIKEEIMGELKDMREEHDTHSYSHTRINDDIQEHDDRLKALELAKN